MTPDDADAEICATAVTVRPRAIVAPGVVGASEAGSDCASVGRGRMHNSHIIKK